MSPLLEACASCLHPRHCHELVSAGEPGLPTVRGACHGGGAVDHHRACAKFCKRFDKHAGGQLELPGLAGVESRGPRARRRRGPGWSDRPQ